MINWGTAAVLIVLIAIVAWIIWSMIRDKKAGKSLSCGMDCSKCSGHCRMQQTQEKKD